MEESCLDITSITKSTAPPFEGLLPAAELERVLDGRVFGLGAICEDGEGLFAAGVLTFSIDEGTTGDEDLIASTIHWFYVAESFRRRGAGAALLQEFFRVTEGSGVEHLLCDVPMPEQYDELCAYLEDWGFDFQLADVSEVETTLGALSKNPAIQHAAPMQVLPLEKVSGRALRSFFSSLSQRDDAPADLRTNIALCSRTLSCAKLVNGGAVDGVLLVRLNAQSELELSLLASLSNSPHTIGEMVAFAARTASATLPPEATLRYLCRTDAACQATAKLFPKLSPLLVRRGYLSNVQEGDSANE